MVLATKEEIRALAIKMQLFLFVVITFKIQPIILYKCQNNLIKQLALGLQGLAEIRLDSSYDFITKS